MKRAVLAAVTILGISLVPSAPAEAQAPPPEPVVVVVERAPEPEPAPSPQQDPEPPVATPDALELLKERDRRLTADAKLRLVRD